MNTTIPTNKLVTGFLMEATMSGPAARFQCVRTAEAKRFPYTVRKNGDCITVKGGNLDVAFKALSRYFKVDRTDSSLEVRQIS